MPTWPGFGKTGPLDCPRSCPATRQNTEHTNAVVSVRTLPVLILGCLLAVTVFDMPPTYDGRNSENRCSHTVQDSFMRASYNPGAATRQGGSHSLPTVPSRL